MTSNFHITDRRLNPQGKSLNNRKRFVERVKASVKAAANKQIKNRSIQDQSDVEVSVTRDGIEEPQFHYSRDNGSWDHVLPGNTDYTVGDTIPRPKQGGGGRGNQGSADGDGEDDFRFGVSHEEFLNVILEDLSLPDMIKQSEKQTVSYSMRRAGYTTVGATNNLALERTMIQSIGRRLALKTPKLAQIESLLEEFEETDDEQRRLEIEEEVSSLRAQANAVNFIEKSDLRYVNFQKQPNPITRAVMFCVMDVSGSMTEHMKDLAKRFYLLLYVFLKRQYKQVDVVFIRHTHIAAEVDQDTFFNSPETGGTVVSTAYEEVKKIIQDRYSVADWNIYMAQASDGDNTYNDMNVAQSLLTSILPWIQYMTYVEVGTDNNSMYTPRDSELWTMFESLTAVHKNVQRRKLTQSSQVIEVFRSLFKKKETTA